MEVNITGRLIERDPLASELIDFLRQRVDKLSLEEAELYYDFPILKDLDYLIQVVDTIDRLRSLRIT